MLRHRPPLQPGLLSRPQDRRAAVVRSVDLRDYRRHRRRTRNLLFAKETADRLFGNQYVWSVLAAGRHQMAFTTMAGINGGNVRVGLEDSLYIGKGQLAKSNAEQVAKIRRILEDLSLEIATPAEAREMLKLKGGDRVGFDTPTLPPNEVTMSSDILAPLTIDFLAWPSAEPRDYIDVMDAWRTSCPRLTVWEDAIDAGLITRTHRLRPTDPHRTDTARRGPAGRPSRIKTPPQPQTTANRNPSATPAPASARTSA